MLVSSMRHTVMVLWDKLVGTINTVDKPFGTLQKDENLHRDARSATQLQHALHRQKMPEKR